MNAKFLTLCCVGMIAFLSAGQGAQAQSAAPPVGSWQGKFHDGSGGITLEVGGNGFVFIHITGAPAITGEWTWTPSSRGGIITIHYINGGRHSRLYYSVTYFNPDQINFSDPFFQLPLSRR